MRKNDLLHKLKEIEGLNPDERAYLIALVNTRKKYGLVWENKPEDVEEQMRTQLPVLREISEKRILGRELPQTVQDTPQLFDIENASTEPYPNHILIEGDNLHALTALTFTHESRIDVIYIDPPYNTGNKDFKYNDHYVDREDAYRHSKWLSFMHKRLIIAKRLLSESGVIFISIDDNEQAQLKLLCDEVFGEGNFVANIVWKKKTNGNNMGIIPPVHDFISVYSKNINLCNIAGLEFSKDYLESRYSNPDNDKRGAWTTSDLSANHAGPFFAIKNPANGDIFYPPKGRYWVFNEDEVKKRIEEGRIIFGKNGSGRPIQKKFLEERSKSRKKVETWWDNHGLNADGTAEIAELVNSKIFAHPKPSKLLKFIFSMIQPVPSTILDFFAGSGTTLHATMQLNAEDGGRRRCILVTNNENNICEEVTYERNRRVIEGYTNAKGETVKGLRHNNLRYYRSEFVDRSPSLQNKKSLTRLATELLCIKEDCYIECTFAITGQTFRWLRIFTNETEQYLCVVYDDQNIEEAVKILEQLILKKNPVAPISVYVFSNGQYPYTEEFEEVLDRVRLCALSDAIYKAYQHVLPQKSRPQEVEDVMNEDTDHD